MTVEGEINWTVSIKVQFSKQAITLSQSDCVKQVLERFHRMECRGVTTCFENHSLVPAGPGTGTKAEITQYQALIGSIMYAALGTRPVITFATTFLSQFSSSP